MAIYKPAESYDPLYALKLENGVMLIVFGDYALGSDGKTYYSITEVKTVYDEEYDFDEEDELISLDELDDSDETDSLDEV